MNHSMAEGSISLTTKQKTSNTIPTIRSNSAGQGAPRPSDIFGPNLPASLAARNLRGMSPGHYMCELVRLPVPPV